jgi:RND family efflux transporter MFP subunit
VIRERRLAGWALAALLSVHCDGRRAAVEAPPPPAEPALDVSVVRVGSGAIAERISAPGSVLARRESQIGTMVSGRIERVFVSEGDRVGAGAPLFQIDPGPYAAALRGAEAGLDLARAERRQLEADLARARELEREKIVAPQQLDRLATSLAVARARERQAVEAVAIARQDLERTRVVAPYAGSVASRLADEGTTALVQPQTIVLVLQETAELEAKAAIPESQLQRIQPGDPARLFVEGITDPIETAVAAVGDTIDPATRTYLVTMRVANADRRLKAGVFARVEIRPRAREAVALVPRAALRTEEGRNRVLVVRDGHAHAVPVEVGVVSDELAEILRGVEPGEPVIVGEAAGALAPGMRVRVVAEGPTPTGSGSEPVARGPVP